MAAAVMVYIAGPLTATDGYTVEQNVAEAVEAYLKLVAAGVPAICPHLAALVVGAFAIDYEKWMAQDFAQIDVSTHVLMLPRWKASLGARRELAYAKEQQKALLFSVDEALVL